MPINMAAAAEHLYGNGKSAKNRLFNASYIERLAQEEEEKGVEGVLTDGWIAEKMRSDPQFFAAAMRTAYEWGKKGVEYDPEEPDMATGTTYNPWFARAYEAGKNNEAEPDFESWFDEANEAGAEEEQRAPALPPG